MLYTMLQGRFLTVLLPGWWKSSWSMVPLLSSSHCRALSLSFCPWDSVACSVPVVVPVCICFLSLSAPVSLSNTDCLWLCLSRSLSSHSDCLFLTLSRRLSLSVSDFVPVSICLGLLTVSVPAFLCFYLSQLLARRLFPGIPFCLSPSRLHRLCSSLCLGVSPPPSLSVSPRLRVSSVPVFLPTLLHRDRICSQTIRS